MSKKKNKHSILSEKPSKTVTYTVEGNKIIRTETIFAGESKSQVVSIGAIDQSKILGGCY